MSERIVLDPAEVATSRTEFDITPWVAPAGPDWGDGDVEAYRASGQYGYTVVDFRIPNRQVQIPLMVKTVGGTSFATVRSMLQQKAQLFQREGGWLKRVTAAGTFFADVQMSGLKFSGGWMQAVRDADTDAAIALECSPDFYGAEVTGSDNVETSAAEVRFTLTNVGGNYPARVRIAVDEDQGQAQMGLMWHLRCRNYSSASTAASAYEAEALQTLDTASRAALTGASGGTVVTHGTLATSWTPVLSTNIGGTSYMTHVGTYRLFCRYRTTSGTAVSMRAVYDVGDLALPVENGPWYHPAGTAGTSFYIADLGELRLNQAPTGTHRWQGQIQARGAAGSENVSLDRVWFQDVSESAGLLRVSSPVVEGLTTFSARDNFDSHATGANLTTKTAPVGGAWTGGGDANDFQTSTPGAPYSPAIARADLSDTAPRIDWLPVSMTDIVVQADVDPGTLGVYGGITSQEGVDMAGVGAAVDASNFVSLSIKARNSERALEVAKTIAGSKTVLASMSLEGRIVSNGYYRLRLQVDAAGRWWAYFVQSGGSSGGGVVVTAPNIVPSLVMSGQDDSLATGGTLATRKPAVVDYCSQNASGSLPVRRYDNFLGWVSTSDAAVFASQSAELRTDGMFREDVSGSAYGPVSWVEGQLPRLPVSGIEGRTIEGMFKLSRGDFATFPDGGIDDASVKLFWRPCWLQAPGT